MVMQRGVRFCCVEQETQSNEVCIDTVHRHTFLTVAMLCDIPDFVGEQSQEAEDRRRQVLKSGENGN